MFFIHLVRDLIGASEIKFRGFLLTCFDFIKLLVEEGYTRKNL